MFTDFFIKRPPLSAAFGILIVVLGLVGYSFLPLQQFPDISLSEVSITTVYHGASAKDIANFVSKPIEKVVASVQGVDYVSSRNIRGMSQVTAHLRYGYKVSDVLAEITGKVATTRASLPKDAYPPSVVRGAPMQYYDIAIAFSSSQWTESELTAFVENKIRPKVFAAGDISLLNIAGGASPALRVNLASDHLMAMNTTVNEAVNSMLASNVRPTAGQVMSTSFNNSILLSSSISSPDDFKAVSINQPSGDRIRLSNVANIDLGSEERLSSTMNNGQPSIFLLVIAESDVLGVTKNIRQMVESIKQDLPEGVSVSIPYDASQAIRDAIEKVVWAMSQAVMIVILVLMVFLGSVRAVIPSFVAIPLSMMGVLFSINMLGYSINMITLLAMILSVSLVVDDAIIVTENIYRYLAQGMNGLQAALTGMREIASPIIVMTFTLIAVFMPMAMTTGPTATVFAQFVFTLTFAVVASALIALFISPAVCVASLPSHQQANKADLFFEHRLLPRFKQAITLVLTMKKQVLLFLLALILFTVNVSLNIKQEFVPAEDLGWYFTLTTMDENSGLKHLESANPQLTQLQSSPYVKANIIINGNQSPSSIMGLVTLDEWQNRPSIFSLLKQVQQNNFRNPYQTTIVNPPSIPGSPYPMIKLVLSSQGDLDHLLEVGKQLKKNLKATNQFIYADLSVKQDKLQVDFDIDRIQADALQIPIQAINDAIFLATSPTETGNVSLYNNVYKVIPQFKSKQLMTPRDLEAIEVKSLTGKVWPLSSVVSIKYSQSPNNVEHFQQQLSVTLTLMQLPILSMGEALNTVDHVVKQSLPSGIQTHYIELAKRLKESSATFMFSFILSLIFVYLALVAQFNSFLDPWVILVTVPASTVGALVPMALGIVTFNIYSQIALITLVGIMSKIGILIVEFANNLRQNQGVSVETAIVEASAIRLKPILMTTFALLFGVLPLVFGSGASAVSCLSIGSVIFFGALLGTLLTLIILPVLYCLLASDERTASA